MGLLKMNASADICFYFSIQIWLHTVGLRVIYKHQTCVQTKNTAFNKRSSHKFCI